MKTVNSTTPFQIMVKPIGAQCNLRCDYCFYLEKINLYSDKKAANYRMNDVILETLIRKQIQSRKYGQTRFSFPGRVESPH